MRCQTLRAHSPLAMPMAMHALSTKTKASVPYFSQQPQASRPASSANSQNIVLTSLVAGLALGIAVCGFLLAFVPYIGKISPFYWFARGFFDRGAEKVKNAGKAVGRFFTQTIPGLFKKKPAAPPPVNGTPLPGFKQRWGNRIKAAKQKTTTFFTTTIPSWFRRATSWFRKKPTVQTSS